MVIHNMVTQKEVDQYMRGLIKSKTSEDMHASKVMKKFNISQQKAEEFIGEWWDNPHS